MATANAPEIDDELPTLSAETFSALQQFYTEQEDREQARLEAEVEVNEARDLEPVDFDKIEFSEDWQMSQFWYDDATARAFADECVRIGEEVGKSKEEVKIACISCPTLYIALKKHFPDRKNGKLNVVLLALTC